MLAGDQTTVPISFSGFPGQEDPDAKMTKALRLDNLPKKVIDKLGVKTFNLSKPAEVAEWAELYPTIMAGDPKIEVVAYERIFIPTEVAWYVHIEWLEYKIDTGLNKKELK